MTRARPTRSPKTVALSKYPSPRPDKEKFSEFWGRYLPLVVERDNFKEAHLHQLHLLCELSVEYDNLSSFLELAGMTYETEGRHGMQIKMRPEVAQKNQVLGQISVFLKMLGITLVKDSKTTVDETAQDAWD